jgi:hypothetical protein
MSGTGRRSITGWHCVEGYEMGSVTEARRRVFPGGCGKLPARGRLRLRCSHGHMPAKLEDSGNDA